MSSRSDFVLAYFDIGTEDPSIAAAENTDGRVCDRTSTSEKNYDRKSGPKEAYEEHAAAAAAAAAEPVILADPEFHSYHLCRKSE